MKTARLFAFASVICLACGAAFAQNDRPSERFDGGYLGLQAGFGRATADFTLANVPIFDSDVTGGLFGFLSLGWV